MRRRKRFTIRVVALGLAIAGISALPAQAKLDEGLNGLQPLSVETETLVTADDIGRVSPGPSFRVVGVERQQIVAPDDMSGRVSPAPSQASVVASDDGFELGTIGVSSIVLLLAAGTMFVAIYSVRSRRLASV